MRTPSTNCRARASYGRALARSSKPARNRRTRWRGSRRAGSGPRRSCRRLETEKMTGEENMPRWRTPEELRQAFEETKEYACQISMWDNAPDRRLVRHSSEARQHDFLCSPACVYRDLAPMCTVFCQLFGAIPSMSSCTPSLHFPLCPHSRSIRIVFAELGVEAHVVEERPLGLAS